MPLTKKGKKILSSMRETYGDDEEAKRVFYASANKGRIKGVHKVKDADGHEWTRGAHLSDTQTELVLEKGAIPTRDGYLKAMARVARVGVQTYRGYELGMPERDHVTLWRPPEEVFARDAMRSLANKPITLTHPKTMVDKSTWGKVAKGWSGNEVVRDGEFVRVPLMLADAAAIAAYEDGSARELSVGYSTDIDWTPGTTPEGQPFDGVQRAIRGNHHALVPVARGGEQLRFGDAGQSESQGAGLSQCPNCGASLTGGPLACPICGFDLSPTAHPGDDISDFDEDSADEADNAASGGITEEGVMPVIKQFDGIPISFHDEASAALMEREFRTIQQKLADAGSDNFGGKKSKPFGNKDGNGDDDDDDTEAKRKKVTAEDALKKDIATRDGEIAVLKKQLADAVTTEAKVEAMAAERIALIDAAKPFLPKDFKDAGKSLADIRRAVVSTSFTDAEMKDWTDDQIIGAFRTMSKVGAGAAKGGASAMADGLSAGMRSSAGYLGSQSAITDGEKMAEAEYQNYVKRLNDGYKNPLTVVRN